MATLFKGRVRKQLKEMTTRAFSGLRDSMDAVKAGFRSAPTTDVLYNTNVDYGRARQLYYNTDPNLSNGAFFARSIVDGIADHVGLPTVTMHDEQIDSLINKWVQDRWPEALWEMYRNSLRDTRCWVRLRRPFDSPLLADDERDDVVLEIIPAGSVTPYYDPFTKLLIRVEIDLDVFIEEEPFDPNTVAALGARVYGREHSITEIITPDQYLYYDRTAGEILDRFTVVNDWGFVPLVEVFNDYDSVLNGGSSEIEVVYPFFQAFHDLVVQTRSAHAYHSDPKVKFKLDDVMNFLRNNFPEAFDNEGKFTGKVSWRNRDIFFMESEEDVGFIEANLDTNNSVTLMEFIIDCICIAAGITEAVLFRAKSETVGESDELFRFKTKIDRKRKNFATYIQQVIKMAMVISTQRVTTTPSLSWQPLQMSDQVTQAQAMNQVVTAAEVAQRAGVISKATYRSRVRPFFPAMKNDQTEQTQALSDMNAEQQLQLEYEKQLLALNPVQTTPGATNGKTDLSLGANSISRRARVRLPTNILPPSPGN